MILKSMKLYIVVAVLFFSTAKAQSEFGGSFSVPRAGNLNVAPSGSISGEKSIFDLPKRSSSDPLISAPENKFGQTKQFENPGDRVVKKLNSAESSELDKTLRKNIYFGDVRTKSPVVSVIFRDNGEQDGDLVTVKVNDVEKFTNIFLETDAKVFRLPLVEGFNKVDIHALNQGLVGPNTAEFQIIDDTGRIFTNGWRLLKDFMATVIIVKE